MGCLQTGWPPISAFLDMIYGSGGVDWGGFTAGWFGNASGLVFNGNPVYTVTQFSGFYKKFLGPPTDFTGLTITAASATITGFTDPDIFATLAVGQLLVSPNFAPDAMITAIGVNEITVSAPALTSGTTATVYVAPFVPMVVILTFINLASFSVMSNRYFGSWSFMMALFVAHYCTLFMRTESGSNLTVSEVMSSGLTKGVLISRHAGDVGATSQILASYEQWGAWSETQYGEQFITIARATNCGPIFVQ